MTREPNNLIRSLVRLRRRLRVVLVVDGVSRLVAAIMGTFALLAVLDWWVHFPPLVRASFLSSAVIWTIAWSWKRIWRPLFRPIALDQLVLSLPTLTQTQRDRLAGAVAHLRGAGDGDAALWSRATFDAGEEAGQLNLSLGINPRRAMRSTFAVVALIGSLFFAAAKLPEWLSIGQRRMVTPFADVQWPKSTQIEPLSGDKLVAHGETFTAEMNLTRGDDPNLRGFIHWRSSDRPYEKAMMRRDPDGVYRRLIERLTSDVSYYFSAGDDDTSDRPGTLRLVKRPTVASATLTITPPPYASQLPVREHHLSDPRVSLVRGCRIRLSVLSDKSVTFGEASTASRVVFESGTVLPLRSDETVGTTGSIEMEVDEDCAFEILLVDNNKFESRGGPRYQLDVVPDRPPAVAIKEPAGPLEVTPTATVDVLIRAEDDLGISRISLLASSKSGEFSLVGDIPSKNDAASLSGSLVTLTGSLAWNLASRKSLVGDTIDYVAEATDFYERHGERHKPARSAVMRLNIVSPERFAERLRQDVLTMRGSLRKMLSSLEAIRGQIEQVRTSTTKDETRHERTERASADARRLTQLVDEASRRLAQLNRRAEMNQSTDSDAARQSQRLAKRLSDAVLEGVTRATKNMADLERASSDADRQSRLQDSSAGLDRAASGLRSMLDEVEQWDSFDEMVRKLHDLIDGQEGLVRRTARLMKQPPDSISQDSAMIAADQSVAQADAAKLLSAMDTLASQLQERDRPSAESLTRAAQSARQGSLLPTMTEAAEAVRTARLIDASAGQERAASVMRSMLVALREKPKRELEQLSRQVQDLHAKLTKIITVQEDLRKKTGEARGSEDSSSRMTLLADRQASVENTTRTLTESMKINGTEAEEAKDELLATADHMASAVTWLKDTEAVEAQDSQRGALESLAKVMALLEKIEDQAMNQLAEKSMAAIIESLKELRTRQTALRDQTATIEARLKDRETIPRADALALSRIAKDQEALLEPLASVRTKVEKSVVYDYVCGEVAEAMKSAVDELSARQATRALAKQEAVLRGLTQLIDAVDDRPKNDDPRFASENSGGGGPSKPTPANPVPTLAELKILRLIQTELNSATTTLDKAMSTATPTGEQQSQIEILGARQRKVQEMAQKMIEKAGAQ